MIKETVQKYLSVFPGEEKNLGVLLGQLARGENLRDRKNFTGHVTASGLIIDKNNQVLMIHHKVFKRYQQPGGHMDEDRDPAVAAHREVKEETGLDLVLHPWHTQHGGIPININTHSVPANAAKQELVHAHHDCMYVFVHDPNQDVVLEEEIESHRWFSLTDRHGLTMIDYAIDKLYKQQIV